MRMTGMSRLLIILPLLCSVPAAFSTDLSVERVQFRAAWAAAQAGDLQSLVSYLNELSDYPLYPYLRYAYLKATLAKQPDDVVQAFLDQQADLPVADDLRRAWLVALAQRGDWKGVLAQYQDETDPVLRCAAVSAHLANPQDPDRDAWIVAAQHLWLVPQRQPETCEPAFGYLKQHHRITNDMVAARVQAALLAHRYDFARSLLPQLANRDWAWAHAWLNMAADPAHELEVMQVPDEPHYQMMLMDGVQQVAHTDPDRAWHLWHALSHRYHFPHDDAEAVTVRLALEAAWHLQPDAAARLARVSYTGDLRVAEWRVRLAVRAADWKAVLQLLPALGDESDLPVWRYWQARALAGTGHADAADAIYETLAQDMSYYGFLAADRLHLPYAITQQPSQPAPDVIAQLQTRPGFVRARELVYAGLYSYAESEWSAVSAELSRPARCQAALMAAQWGWYARSIRSLNANGCWQDLDLSYPIAFEDALMPQLRKLKLNPAWVYGLIRSESLFQTDAVSRVGALGLMQLMPATGRHVAKRLGLTFEDGALLDPDTNLKLGSAYLDQILQRFDGSEPLATAAYNAGPRRVASWLPARGDLPADVWVDSIPFPETRGYVHQVMAQSVVFDWRLHGGQAGRLIERLGQIAAAPMPATVAAPAAASVPITAAAAPPGP